MEKIKVLFAGESWFFTTIETKGFDQFTIGGYQTEIGRIRAVMDTYADITHIPAHLVLEEFPDTVEKLKAYDVVIISDVGANTFYLHPKTFFNSIPTPNKLQVLADYVAQGGAFGMMGGYMTFQGIEAKGQYRGTPVEEILPVNLYPYDDRAEHPEGLYLNVDPDSHPLLAGFPEKWPPMLGYNRLIAKENADVVVKYKEDPILALGTYGKGKTFAWASDCAPHWLPEEFCEWEYNKILWERILKWAVNKD